MLIAPAEAKMWDKSSSSNGKSHMSDQQINAKYEQGQPRILTEMNREKLPSFADSLKKPKYMDISPFYQRRLRWDKQKQSQLIESFLINKNIAYCQPAIIQSIQIEGESFKEIEATQDIEIGLKFDVDAKVGLDLYLLV